MKCMKTCLDTSQYCILHTILAGKKSYGRRLLWWRCVAQPKLFADRAAGSQNVLRQGAGSCLGVARLERLEDFPVLANRVVPARTGRQGEIAGAFGTRQQRTVGRLQDPVLGTGHDEAVYFLIDPEILFQLSVVVVRFHALLKLRQSLQFLICNPCGSELGRNALDGADDLEYLVNFVLAQRRDLRASVRPQYQEPFRRKQLERF